MSGVHLLGVGATALSQSRREPRTLAREAIAAALADAGVAPKEVDGLAIAAANIEFDLGCYDVLGRRSRPFRCRCGLGAVALHSGWNAVASGASDVVVCVGGDGMPAPNGHDAAVEAQAAAARLYLRDSGATEEHLARIAAKNRSHGVANPRALTRTEVAADEVMRSEVLAWPLRRLMVAEPVQAAAAVVLGSHEARRRGPRAPRVRASVLLDAGSADGAATVRAARLGYFSAELGPEDVDVAEIDDPTPVDELAAYEALEFAPPGRGPELVESGFTALGGVLPVNPSGGSLAQGAVSAAGGLLQMVELSQQLSARAGRRQVPGARTALALTGSWMPAASVTSLTILST
ncbi:MAG TPA: thiolase family protein [Solirubrobacterales bacterium]|nr:thiolase family protein [Solirubrobacterales bacterium]